MVLLNRVILLSEEMRFDLVDFNTVFRESRSVSSLFVRAFKESIFSEVAPESTRLIVKTIISAAIDKYNRINIDPDFREGFLSFLFSLKMLIKSEITPTAKTREDINTSIKFSYY